MDSRKLSWRVRGIAKWGRKRKAPEEVVVTGAGEVGKPLLAAVALPDPIRWVLGIDKSGRMNDDGRMNYKLLGKNGFFKSFRAKASKDVGMKNADEWQGVLSVDKAAFYGTCVDDARLKIRQALNGNVKAVSMGQQILEILGQTKLSKEKLVERIRAVASPRSLFCRLCGEVFVSAPKEICPLCTLDVDWGRPLWQAYAIWLTLGEWGGMLYGHLSGDHLFFQGKHWAREHKGLSCEMGVNLYADHALTCYLWDTGEMSDSTEYGDPIPYDEKFHDRLDAQLDKAAKAMAADDWRNCQICGWHRRLYDTCCEED